MKKLLSTIALTACLAPPAATAASVAAFFDGNAGTLVIPHLEVKGKIYYATLTLTDASTLSFTTNISERTNITPPETELPINTSASAIVGTWAEEAGSSDSTYITFFEDGTYEQLQRAGDDGNCPGGYETGTWSWEPSTGLLLPRVETDENESCGLSHPRHDVPLRIFINGDSMQILEKGETFGEDLFFMFRMEE